jgi:hypothetical protein
MRELKKEIKSYNKVHKWCGFLLLILAFFVFIMEQINKDPEKKKVEDNTAIAERTLDINSHCPGKRIVDGVKDNSPKLRSVISNYPDINGEVLIAIGINTRGFVDTCFIEESDITDAVFLKEVIDSIRTFQFNPVDREDDYILITYPFVFTH